MPDHVQLKIPINKETAIAIIEVLVIAAIAGTYFYQTYPTLRASIDLIRNLLVAALTIVSILITASSIRDGIHERRQASAFALIARYNNPTFESSILEWTLIWRKFEKDPTKAVEIIEPPPRPKGPTPEYDSELNGEERPDDAAWEKNRRAAVRMFNFFEEIAIAVEAGGVDEGILKDYFAEILTQYYEPTRPWVKYCQENKGKGIYVKLSALVQRWERKEIASPEQKT